MANKVDRYEVIFFQTETSGSRIVSLNGSFLSTSDPIYEMKTEEFVKDLGIRRFEFVSQIPVTMHNGGKRINWVFQRVLPSQA